MIIHITTLLLSNSISIVIKSKKMNYLIFKILDVLKQQILADLFNWATIYTRICNNFGL
jgi:hypothetical protein